MTDIFSKEKRSLIMSRIKGKNTLLERLGFEILKKAGVRFRKHSKGIYGKPDAALKKRKIAVFFDSDFWHGFDFENSLRKRLPNDYWIKRIGKNIERDREVSEKLRNEGWVVVRFWEHEIERDPRSCLDKLRYVLKYKNQL